MARDINNPQIRSPRVIKNDIEENINGPVIDILDKKIEELNAIVKSPDYKKKTKEDKEKIEDDLKELIQKRMEAKSVSGEEMIERDRKLNQEKKIADSIEKVSKPQE